MIISEKIFLLLEKKGMSQKEFSERTGISQSTISDWKQKKTNPSANKIMKICQVLHVTPYELLAEEDLGQHEDAAEKRMAMNQEEAFLLESYRDFVPRQKERLMGYLTALRELR